MRVKLKLFFFYREKNSECRQSKIILERILPKFAGLLSLLEVNYDLQREICREYKVYGVPTLVIIDDNRIVNRYSGIPDQDQLENLLIQSLQDFPE